METIGTLLRECFSQGLIGLLDDKRPDETVGDWFERLRVVDEDFVSYFHGIHNDE